MRDNIARHIATERNVRLDFIRILAILECIVSHALCGKSDLSLVEYQWIIMFFPDTAAMFIMSSGALILGRGSRNDWRYVWHRISTFLPEFIIFSTLYVFLDNAYGFDPEEYSTLQRLCYMLVTPTWGPGWFILALIGVYLVTPFISVWINQATKRQVEIAIAIWLVGTILPMLVPHIVIDIPVSAFGTIFNYSGYLIIGYYLHRWPFKLRSSVFKLLYFAITISVGIGFGYLIGRSGAKWNYIAGLNSGISLTIVMISLLQYGIVLELPERLFTGLFARICVQLSILSLGIYCAHWLVIQYWAIPEHVEWVISTLVTLAISIPAAWIMRSIRLFIVRLLARRKE